MEYSQTPRKGRGYRPSTAVLILILMEYSQTMRDRNGHEVAICLNPYSNGILTDKKKNDEHCSNVCVLILILMEYSQTGNRFGIQLAAYTS